MIDLHEPDIPEPVSLGIPEPVSIGIPGPVSVGIPGPVSMGIPGPVSVVIPEAVPAGFPGPVTMHVPTIMLNDGIGSDTREEDSTQNSAEQDNSKNTIMKECLTFFTHP